MRAVLPFVALLCVLARPGVAQEIADPWTACRRAIAAAEPASGIPPGLLMAIALVESGRGDPRSGRIEPWPFAYNTSGEGHLPATAAAAVREVAALLAGGARSVDVGCMQINLQSHPAAFPSLEQGFDPEANVAYAIRFLRQLQARTGDWADAVALYHSGDPERGLAYHQRVVMARLGAAFTRGGTVALPMRAVAGLCAPGLQPGLRLVGMGGRRAMGAARRPHVVCLRPGRLPG